MTVLPAVIRPATPADAPAIARIHVTSWRETYAGLMPDDFLDRMTGEEGRQRREANWQRTISQGLETVLVAEQDGNVVAFASAGAARDHPGYKAELMTLYALKSAQGQELNGRCLGNCCKAYGRTGFGIWPCGCWTPTPRGGGICARADARRARSWTASCARCESSGTRCPANAAASVPPRPA